MLSSVPSNSEPAIVAPNTSFSPHCIHTCSHAKITMLTTVTQPSTYFRYFYLKITQKIIWGTCKMPRKDVSTDLRTVDTDGLC